MIQSDDDSLHLKAVLEEGGTVGVEGEQRRRGCGGGRGGAGVRGGGGGGGSGPARGEASVGWAGGPQEVLQGGGSLFVRLWRNR